MLQALTSDSDRLQASNGSLFFLTPNVLTSQLWEVARPSRHHTHLFTAWPLSRPYSTANSELEASSARFGSPPALAAPFHIDAKYMFKYFKNLCHLLATPALPPKGAPRPHLPNPFLRAWTSRLPLKSVQSSSTAKRAYVHSFYV